MAPPAPANGHPSQQTDLGRPNTVDGPGADRGAESSLCGLGGEALWVAARPLDLRVVKSRTRDTANGRRRERGGRQPQDARFSHRNPGAPQKAHSRVGCKNVLTLVQKILESMHGFFILWTPMSCLMYPFINIRKGTHWLSPTSASHQALTGALVQGMKTQTPSWLLSPDLPAVCLPESYSASLCLGFSTLNHGQQHPLDRGVGRCQSLNIHEDLRTVPAS